MEACRAMVVVTGLIEGGTQRARGHCVSVLICLRPSHLQHVGVSRVAHSDQRDRMR